MDYKDRQGNIIHENNSQDRLLKFMYSNVLGRMVLRAAAGRWVSQAAGIYMDSWMSTFKIDSFVKNNNIKMSDYEKKRYKSYNEFFTRKLKKNKRLINKEPSGFISPCDGRVSIYPINLNSVFHIKNSVYSVETFLKNARLAKEYVGGYCVIVRLTVSDYHRYCYVDDAVKGRNCHIDGKFYTVHPAVLGNENIYKENTREYTVLETKNLGKVVQAEVGALMVGRIKNYHKQAVVSKGQEKGRFEFGGSTVVLLVKRDEVAFDDDILKNTLEGYETKVSMGEVIGRAMY